MNRTRWLAAVAVAAVLISVLMVGRGLLRGGRPGTADDPRRTALAELTELRDAVAECNAEIDAEQERFRTHEARVDSLRAIVEAYESDERTVPAGHFDAYLQAFDAYNESVSDWHERAATLQATYDSCRTLAERHNALVDSLSARPVRPTGPG